MTVAWRSALYHGTLMHARHDRWARRAFTYPVFMASLDLSELPALDASLPGFGYNRWAPYGIADRDYAESAGPGLSVAHAGHARAAGWPIAPHTRLLTNLRTAGYVFNPVSFFADFDDGAAISPARVFAEVNNTYGGRRRYVLDDACADAAPAPGFRSYTVPRDFFVSPFLHGPMTYQFEFAWPRDGETLRVRMQVCDVDAPPKTPPRLVSDLRLKRTPLTAVSLARASVRFPWMAAQVIGLIHLQAVRLRRLGVPYHTPDASHAARAVDGP